MRILSKSLASFFAALTLPCGIAVAADPVDVQDATASMLEAELGFARASEEKGTQPAFVEYLADDAIGFSPEPSNAKKYWTTQKFESVLIWRPEFGCTAGSGELGYTIGPSEARKTVAAETVEYTGHFATVWKRKPNGPWRVALDIGISNPPPQQKVKDTVASTCSGVGQAEAKSARKSLKEAQRLFAERLKKDAGSATMSFVDAETRLLRGGGSPAVGMDAARLMLSSDHSKVTRTEAGSGISNAADIAYSYGSYSAERTGTKESGFYLAIWKLNAAGEWKLAVDLSKKAPPPK